MQELRIEEARELEHTLRGVFIAWQLYGDLQRGSAKLSIFL
jgi:hypothetical protein